jgi:hypothetical protein
MGLLGGPKHEAREARSKAKDLTREEILLKHAKRQGAVTAVDLLSSATVHAMGGTELEVKLDESQNAAGYLKLAIQDEQGVSSFAQQLFLVSKNNSGDDEDEL